MENAIRQILTNIPSNSIFDSHFVINILTKNFTDEYLQFAAQYSNSSQPTLSTHGQIGQIISSFRGDLVEQVEQLAMKILFSGESRMQRTLHVRFGGRAVTFYVSP